MLVSLSQAKENYELLYCETIALKQTGTDGTSSAYQFNTHTPNYISATWNVGSLTYPNNLKLIFKTFIKNRNSPLGTDVYPFLAFPFWNVLQILGP